MANEDKATRYQRLRRRAAVASTVLVALTFLGLWMTGASAAIRSLAAAIAGSSSALTVVLYVGFLGLLFGALQFPLAFYQGVVLERRYGLSTHPTAVWLRDRLTADAIGLVFAIAGASIVWGLIRWSPEYWWAMAAAVFVALLVLLAQLAPVLLLPLFYTFTPLERPALVQRLLLLAERAGARVVGVFEWRLGDRTRKANAALTGIGFSRRILLSDTLLADHTDDEIEVILAHELSHHVHHDIWSGIALDALLIVVGFFAADLALEQFSYAFGVMGKADIAALPLLVLTAGAVSLALVPFANAMSRAHERRADRYALEMTGNASAFTGAMKRLAARNLAEDEPSRMVELLFHTHPPTRARIASAEEWMRARDAAST